MKCSAKRVDYSRDGPVLIPCGNEATLEVKTKYFTWFDPLCDECYESVKDLKYILTETKRQISK